MLDRNENRGSDSFGLPKESLPDTFYRNSAEQIVHALSVVREQLGMDVAFVSEFAGDRQVFHTLEGDAESFEFTEGGSIPLEATFCQRVVEGRLPNVVPDTAQNEEVRDLEITRRSEIGSYIGLPLQFSDGSLYGMVCCLSHSSNSSLRQRDAEFMRVLSHLIMEQLERRKMEYDHLRLQARAAGVDALVAALEARDGYTGEHSEAVVRLSAEVARGMGLPDEEVGRVELAALLHDIGKIGIPDSILNKPGPLDEREWQVMKRHPEIGERIVAAVEGLSHLALCIRAEHERWDGNGYPDGLSDEKIPLPSRIIFACDAFHAMISDRPYRRAMSIQEALEEMQRNSGTQFCPDTAQALVKVVRKSDVV